MRLENKVALVIGVGSGMGAAISLLFAQEGADVALVARSRETIDSLTGKVAALGRRAIPITANATSADDIDRAVATTIDAFGRIDCLIPLPGGGLTFEHELAETDFSEFQRMLDNHLATLFHTTHSAIPHMKAAGGGSIITISASYTVRRDGNIAYGTVKEGVIGFTKNLARELHPHDIRVNCLCPGFVHLPIHAEPVDVPQKGLARKGQPENIAYAALYLASDESRCMTGQILAIDGGIDVLIDRERVLD